MARKTKLEPISRSEAKRRFLDAEKGGGGRTRNPLMDSNAQALTVAPADPKDEQDIRLQHRWFRRPNRMDFEGIDTETDSGRSRRRRSGISNTKTSRSRTSTPEKSSRSRGKASDTRPVEASNKSRRTNRSRSSRNSQSSGHDRPKSSMGDSKKTGKTSKRLTVKDLKERWPNINFTVDKGFVYVGPFGIPQQMAVELAGNVAMHGTTAHPRSVHDQVKWLIDNLDHERDFFRNHGTTDRSKAKVKEPAPTPPAATRPAFRPGQVTQAPSITDPRRSYSMAWRVVDLDSLVTSHDDNFTENPAYPSELQPRIRDRTAPKLQVDHIAKTLAPDALLVDTHQIDRGPMIVGNDLVVESGNGRTLALRRARDEYPARWKEYQTELKKNLADFGLKAEDLKGVKDPVLVRERVTETDRAAFAREANQSAVIQMSPLEQALQDSKLISDQSITQLTVGENQSLDQALTSAANRPLVRHYLDKLPDNERAALLDGKGNLNIQGLQRMKAALFHKVYGGEAGQRLTQAFFESIDPTIKNVEHGLFASLPSMARSEGLIRTGQRENELSMAEDTSKAVDMLARLKQQNLSVEMFLQQSSFVDKELTPEQEKLLAHLSEIGRSPKRIRELFNEYAAFVESAPHPDQGAFFDSIKQDKGEKLDQLITGQRQAMLEGRSKRRQQSLFADTPTSAFGSQLGGSNVGGRVPRQRDLDRAAVAAVR